MEERECRRMLDGAGRQVDRLVLGSLRSREVN